MLRNFLEWLCPIVLWYLPTMLTISFRGFSQDDIRFLFRITNFSSHTTNNVGVNFIYELRILQYNNDCERFEIVFILIFLRSEFLQKGCWEKVAEIFFYITTHYILACIHTYIIGHYNPSIRIIDPVSHITYVMCVNFIHKWRDLQFKVDSERQIWETFHGNFIYFSEFLSEICWEEIAEEILFVFRFDGWPGTRTLAFLLISRNSISLPVWKARTVL